MRNRESPPVTAPATSIQGRTRGLTIVELLIAIVIFSVALLTLGFVLTSNFRGVNEDAKITVANQVAVSIIEEWRVLIGGDTNDPRQYDDGEGGMRTETVDGLDYVASYVLTPMSVDASGNRTTTSSTPDVFELEVRVTPPGSTERTYTTVIARAR